MTKIITCLNQKGGSGKTTVAMNLGATIGARGFKTLVIDGDNQGTATTWYASVPDDVRFPATVIDLSKAGARIGKAMQDHVDSAAYDVILIDTPGSLTDPVPLAALIRSDLALVPVLPSAHDLWATGQLQHLLAQAEGARPELITMLVVNRLERTTVNAAAVESLVGTGVFVAATKLTSRVAYQTASAAGSAIIFGKDKTAIAECESLADEVLAALGLPSKPARAKA
jgi:chromosome partitioning protein